MDSFQNDDLDAELIDALQTDEVVASKTQSSAKHGSKKSIIEKIKKVCNDSDTILEISDSRLNRMNKKELLQLLADKIELAVQNDIAKQAGMQRALNEEHTEEQRSRLVAASFLTMAHKIVTSGVEKAVENYSENYTIAGFSDEFHSSPEKEQMLQETLIEICEEYDVLQYVDSPFSKLGLLWFGAGVKTLQKKRLKYKCYPDGTLPV